MESKEGKNEERGEGKAEGTEEEEAEVQLVAGLVEARNDCQGEVEAQGSSLLQRVSLHLEVNVSYIFKEDLKTICVQKRFFFLMESALNIRLQNRTSKILWEKVEFKNRILSKLKCIYNFS